MKYLVVGDVDQIQNYVFASSRLRAIRGASALLESIVTGFVQRENTSLGARKDFLRDRGGQVVAILDFDDATSADGAANEASKLCARLEACVRRESGGAASITTAYVQYDDPLLFRSALKKAFKKIHKEKDGRQEFGAENAASLASAYYHRCDLLPTQPASFRSLIGDIGEEEERYLSRAAARWEPEAGQPKSEFDRSLLDKLDPTLVTSGYEFPRQPDDLWPGEGGYIGYIAADGNGIGQLLEVIDKESLYEDFSKEMYELVIDSIARAAKDGNVGIPTRRFSKTKRRKSGRRPSTYHYVPLVPVIVAGDDMSLLVRAEHSFFFVNGLCQHFAGQSQARAHIQDAIKIFCRDADYSRAARSVFPWAFDSNGTPKPDSDDAWKDGQPLTLSAGIAIAKKKFPISIYRRLAGEMRDEAKRALRDQGAEGVREGGMIDFAVITTATAQSLEDLRRGYETSTRDRLTMRPYTRDKFGKLLELAKQLKRVPRSKRKFLYTELFAGRAAGEGAYRFVLAREDKRVCEEILKAMKFFGCSRGEAFAVTAPGPKATPIVDALEVSEIIQDEED